MTLIELLTVVLIVALLSGIMAYFITGRRVDNAIVDLNNDVFSMLQAQRMRATSMNVATYIQISSDSIEPRIGANSICAADDAEQYPIHYDNTATSLNVGIDLKTVSDGQTRTLDSPKDSKYVGKARLSTQESSQLQGFANVSVSLASANSEITPAGIVICFQPNGQAYFMTLSGTSMTFQEDATSARVKICSADKALTGGFYLDVTGLGMMSSSQSATACASSASNP